MLLSHTEKLEGLKCQVYFDNYFDSPLLQATLYLKKIFSAETVHINRKMFPNNNQFQQTKKWKEMMQHVWRANTFFSQSGWTISRSVCFVFYLNKIKIYLH